MFREVAMIRKASRRLVREWGLLNGPAPRVSLTQCHALIELDRNGVLTIAGLAEILQLDKSSVSRLTAKLLERKWVAVQENSEDRREKPLVLTEAGRKNLQKRDAAANLQVQNALNAVSAEERATILAGLESYVKALARARMRADLTIREIEPRDNTVMADIIRDVIHEFGLSGSGSGDDDHELHDLSAAFRGEGKAFLVAVLGGKVLGGGGFAPLKGGEKGVCEFQRMYFRPKLRGVGVGGMLLARALEQAKAYGYHTCYLETHHTMLRARRLYERFGFEQSAVTGKTGHCTCNTFYTKRL